MTNKKEENKMTKEKLKELCNLCEEETIQRGYAKCCPCREISIYCQLYELIEKELENNN